MPYPCTVYHRPNGHSEVIDLVRINPEDEAWFREHDLKLSLEEDGANGFIVYGDIGLKNEDGEPDEVIVLSGQMTCQDSLAKLRAECEVALKGQP